MTSGSRSPISSVTDREGRTTWRPLLESLTDWAAAQGVTHYYLRWRERRHRRHETFGLLVLDRILTPEVTAWLADPDPEILQGLLAAVAGIDDGAVLGRLTSAADQASVEQDLRENHIDPAAASLGVPVERYLLDAMRRLARGGRWQINVPGARLWLLAEGLHVVWPAGAQDVIALLAADKVPGIPRDPDTVADILLERGLAVPREEAGRTQRYWRLAPAPLARDGQTVTLAMLRLASPDVVLAGALPAPIEVVMEGSVIPRAAVSGNTPVVAPGPDEGDMSTHAAHVARHPHPPSPSTLDSSEPAGGTAVETRSNTHAAAPPPPVPGAVRSSDDTLAQDERVDEQRPQGAQQAETWFRARGQGGAALLSLGVALAREERAWDERLRLIGDQVLICFPEGLAGLGASPQALLDALASAGLIETDPLAPLRRVRELAGARGALLTKETSRWFLTIAGPPPASRSATSGAIGTVRRPGLSPTSAGVAPNEAGRTETPSELHSAESAVRAAARELIALIRSRDPSIPGGVLQAEGGLSVGPGVAAWFVASHAAVNRYALLRALGKSEGCRIAANGGLTVAGKG